MASGMIMRTGPGKGKKAKMMPKATGATFKMTTPSSSTVTQSVSVGAPKKRFIPGDFNSKRPIDRPTTAETGKALGEAPAKTQARISAQAAGKTSYDFGGKKEYSGRTESVRLPKLTTDVSTTPAKFQRVTTTATTTTPGPEKTSKKTSSTGVIMKKRRLPRVSYLQGQGHGRNKRTESGHGR